MGKVKGKRGKNARRSRQGRLGLLKTVKEPSKKPTQFSKRQEQRDAKKDAILALRDKNAKAERMEPQAEIPKTLHTFVVHTGSVGRYVKRLERDIRRVMEPNTSGHLKVTKRNNFKDFLVHSQLLGVSHLIVLTKNESSGSTNLRIIRNSHGPTISFRVENYTLTRDVLASQKRPVIHQELFKNSPLVVLTGFQKQGKHLQLIQTAIQNMFPSINVDTVSLSTIRRVLLVSYESDTDHIEFRHYSTKVTPAGISKTATNLLTTKKVPDLSKCVDFADYLLNAGNMAESECEDEKIELELPLGALTGGKAEQKTKIRLIEIGPRMTWKLVKIEEGINDGKVLYHAFGQK